MSKPIRSMTGFARITKDTGDGEITVSIKSVNHRGLDLHFHITAELEPFENPMRAAIKRAIARGHVDVRAGSLNANGAAPAGLNEPILKAYLAAFRRVAGAEGLDCQPDLNAMFQLPGLFALGEAPALGPELETVVVSALEEALEQLNEFRSREGAELAAIMRAHNRSIADGAAEMGQLRTTALPAFQDRLSNRLKELLGDVVDPQRIAQEAALIADRTDISEEISRLQIHSRQLNELLDAGGEVGKKLDFLLQEMNRETNTILSKTSGIGELGLHITNLALAAKADIEKIREQSLNLE